MSGDDDAFRREAVRVMRSGPPSDGDNLLGMEIDFDAYLGGLDELGRVSLAERGWWAMVGACHVTGS